MELSGILRYQLSRNVEGIGCVTETEVKEGLVIGKESPLVSMPAWYSERTILSCSRCLKHVCSFITLVACLCADTVPEVDESSGWFFCRLCSLILCPACNPVHISAHDMLCVGEGDGRAPAFKCLRRLGYAISESLFLGLVFIADLIRHGYKLDDSLFSLPRFSYFTSHDVEVGSVIHEAYEHTITILNRKFPFSFYKRIVTTFDQTNLFIEVANSTMLSDISAGRLTSELLSQLRIAHERIGFPILGEDVSQPLPVAVGSGHYPTIARVNHSCDPNVEWRFINGTADIELVALRLISRDEELFISYIDQTQNVAHRRQQLQSLYGFVCECPRCLAELKHR